MIGTGSAIRYTLAKATDQQEAKKYFSNALIWDAIVSVIFIAAGLFFPGQVMRVMGADAVIEAIGIPYIRIVPVSYTHLVGNDAVTQLMPTPAQREMMYDRVRYCRRTKPLFAIDFQNDGEYVGGCVAGGRRYLHINANGDVDPCVFIHYSDSNIREKTLLELSLIHIYRKMDRCLIP